MTNHGPAAPLLATQAYRGRASSIAMTATSESHSSQEIPQRENKIVVLGSLNFDVFLKMQRMPEVGETLATNDDIFKAFGGKGANQAIAAARLNDTGNYKV